LTNKKSHEKKTVLLQCGRVSKLHFLTVPQRLTDQAEMTALTGTQKGVD